MYLRKNTRVFDQEDIQILCPFGERAQPIFFRQAVSFRRVGTC
jgi:hypothetical protein